MLLSSLLDPELVQVKAKAATLDEIIRELLEAMFRHYHFDHSFDTVLAAVKERQALGGIIFPTGLAVPHARIDLFNDILIAIAPLKTPIEKDGVHIKLVVLILTSRTTSNLYLNSLSAFARLSGNPELMASLMSATNSTELVSILQNAAIEIRKELTVDHIMSKPLAIIHPEQSICQMIDICVEHRVNYIPVVDADMNLIGECSTLDILQLGIPNYAQLISNVGIMKTFEPMEELLDKEEAIKASDIMEQASYSFKPDTSLIVAVSAFVKSRRSHIPVLENGILVGIVSQMDILTKVLRG